jgi:GDPmannose 4,6-dehydratase
MKKLKLKALITGISGQDGSYLADLLTDKGYDVYGLERRITPKRRKVKGTIIRGDIRDYPTVYQTINQLKPDEIYHLAAQSFVGDSFTNPFETLNTNIDGTLNILESMRVCSPKSKFYFAGSSEMFGRPVDEPQTEKTPLIPVSPYGISKVAGFNLTKCYRESYNLFACSGILFNHESARRGDEFVTQKIVNGIHEFVHSGKRIKLGNLDIKRDWGYSPDYVHAMWQMLQEDKPDDYVIATNEMHTIREFVTECMKYYGLKEKVEDVVDFDPKFVRPNEIYNLRGDYSKANEKLGWEPSCDFKTLVQIMMRRGSIEIA